MQYWGMHPSARHSSLSAVRPVSTQHPLPPEPWASWLADPDEANEIIVCRHSPLATHPTIKEARALIRPYERCRARSPRSRWVCAQRQREEDE